MDSVRPELIAILNRVAKANGPLEFSENSTRAEIKLVAQLIEDRFLTGTHFQDHEGHPAYARVEAITLTGRKYVDQLEDERHDQSLSGKGLKYLKGFALYALGVVTPLLIQWLTKRFGLN